MCLVNTSTIKFIFYFLYHAPENRNLNNFLGHQAIETVFGTQVFFLFYPKRYNIFTSNLLFVADILTKFKVPAMSSFGNRFLCFGFAKLEKSE